MLLPRESEKGEVDRGSFDLSGFFFVARIPFFFCVGAVLLSLLVLAWLLFLLQSALFLASALSILRFGVGRDPCSSRVTNDVVGAHSAQDGNSEQMMHQAEMGVQARWGLSWRWGMLPRPLS